MQLLSNTDFRLCGISSAADSFCSNEFRVPIFQTLFNFQGPFPAVSDRRLFSGRMAILAFPRLFVNRVSAVHSFRFLLLPLLGQERYSIISSGVCQLLSFVLSRLSLLSCFRARLILYHPSFALSILFLVFPSLFLPVARRSIILSNYLPYVNTFFHFLSLFCCVYANYHVSTS